MRRDAIIAKWENEERTLQFTLHADGQLVLIRRKSTSHAWELSGHNLGFPVSRLVPFDDFIRELHHES